MSEQEIFLERTHIRNYLSLREVTLPLKQLTILVGPNASGKSNILSALGLLTKMIISEGPPPTDFIQERLWAGGATSLMFELEANVAGKRATYKVKLDSQREHSIKAENLTIGEVEVISVQNGEGTVRDEDASNPTKYRSHKLALRSAGDYGDKPVTSALVEFIRGWEFYDFQPKKMRGGRDIIAQIIIGKASGTSVESSESLSLNVDGSILANLLSYWHKNAPEQFQAVNQALESSTTLKLDQQTGNGNEELYLLEGYKTPIPLRRASDGTLRLIAYHILLNQPQVPSLIAIEEPERNLHPAALTEIANVLEQLAHRTQVIITTHSSQLLDALNPDNLSQDLLGILLLQNVRGKGTEVISLEDIRRDRAALDGWITDFGIGSAIFDSELLPEMIAG